MAEAHGKVYNHDIVGIYNRMNRFATELMFSVSANVSQMNTFDQTRLQSYLANVTQYLDHVVAQPQLDLPETSPMEWPLEPMPALPEVENEEVADMLRLFKLGTLELIESQSARQGSGLIPFDEARFRALVGKISNFLANYVQIVTPIDLPESSPDEIMMGPGRRGV